MLSTGLRICAAFVCYILPTQLLVAAIAVGGAKLYTQLRFDAGYRASPSLIAVAVIAFAATAIHFMLTRVMRRRRWREIAEYVEPALP